MVQRKKTKASVFELDDFNLGWLVGIIEGEGSISSRLNSKTGYLTVELTVASTDLDMIDKLDSLYPGKSEYIREYKNHYKTQYIWAVTDRGGVRTVLSKILPHMGSRRRERILEVLNMIDSYERECK